MGRTCHLLVFYSIYSSIILCLMSETIVQQQYYIHIQSSGSSAGANAFLRLDAWNHSRWRFFVYFFGGGILRCIFCCLSVLRLSGNNGFLFILLAHRGRLSQGLLLPPILFPPVSVLLQRHEFGAEGRISPWPESEPHHPRSPTPLSFCFPHNIIPLYHHHPSLCDCLPAPQHCSLMFAYSLIQNNKLKLYSLQPERFALPLSSLSSVFPLFFFFFFYGRFLSVSLESSWLLLRARQQENAGRRGNEMTRWKTVLSAGNGIATVTMCHGGEATVSFLWRLTFLKRWRLKHRLAALPFEAVVPYPRQRSVNNWPSVRPCL